MKLVHYNDTATVPYRCPYAIFGVSFNSILLELFCLFYSVSIPIQKSFLTEGYAEKHVTNTQHSCEFVGCKPLQNQGTMQWISIRIGRIVQLSIRIFLSDGDLVM